MAFDPTKYTAAQVKPLPLCLLLDVSGSMAGNKIDELNTAVREMLHFFTLPQCEGQIHVAIITFSDGATLQLPLTPANQAYEQWGNMQASGCTSMGKAFALTKDMLEAHNSLPSPCYRPLVVLISDGEPTDSWQGPLQNFLASGRSSKCDRMAMSIGANDAGREVLQKFIESTNNPLFEAKDARDISNFFKLVTKTASNSASGKAPSPRSEATPVPSPVSSASQKQPSPPVQDEEDRF